MNIIALAVGIAVGAWCFGRQTISWLLAMLHSSAFSSEKVFYDLYDATDDELSFKRYKAHNSGIEKYADYLKLHSDARATAYTSFSKTYHALKRHIVFRILPIALAPAVLFWTKWYYYLVGIAATFVARLIYETAKNGMRPGFYQRMVVYSALNTYSKQKSRRYTA